MTLAVASFRFLGPIPSEEVSRDHYAVEAKMALEESRAIPDATTALHLRRYALSMERVYRRLGWAYSGLAASEAEEMLETAKARVRRVYGPAKR